MAKKKKGGSSGDKDENGIGIGFIEAGLTFIFGLFGIVTTSSTIQSLLVVATIGAIFWTIIYFATRPTKRTDEEKIAKLQEKERKKAEKEVKKQERIAAKKIANEKEEENDDSEEEDDD